MAPVDPTYPLYPVFCIVVAALLLLMLISNVAKNSWNFGVTLLAFSLFWETLTLGIDAIVWSDNADIKAYIYCDIVSHIHIFVTIVKPACTLIITRRLYRIASLRSIEPLNRREKICDNTLNWSIGVGLPTLVTSVFYYIDQGVRFQVYEGSGCSAAAEGTGIDLVLILSWSVLLPLFSALFYCPKIIYVFYRHSRETNEFLQSNSSISRNSYMRILALGYLDIAISFPLGTIKLVLVAKIASSLPFYYGWSDVHSDWEPLAVMYDDIVESGAWFIAQLYLEQWSSPALGLAVFALFGLTAEARATYWRSIVIVCKFLGWNLPQRSPGESKELTQIQFEQGTVNNSDTQPLEDYEGDGSLASDKAHGAVTTSASISGYYLSGLQLSNESTSADANTRVSV